MNELEQEAKTHIQTLGYEFLDKPVIVGGLAMTKTNPAPVIASSVMLRLRSLSLAPLSASHPRNTA